MPYDQNADHNQAAQADQASQEAQPLTPSTRGRFAQGFGARARTRGGLGQKAMDASRMFWEDQPRAPDPAKSNFGGGSAVGYAPGFNAEDAAWTKTHPMKVYVDSTGAKHYYPDDASNPSDPTWMDPNHDKMMADKALADAAAKKAQTPTPPKDETPAPAAVPTPPAPVAAGAGEGGTVTRPPQTFIGDATQTTPPAKNIPGPNPTGQGFVGDASGSVGTKGLDTGPVYKVAGGGWDSPGFSSFTTPIKMVAPGTPPPPSGPSNEFNKVIAGGYPSTPPPAPPPPTSSTNLFNKAVTGAAVPIGAPGAGSAAAANLVPLTRLTSDVNAKEGIQPIKPIDVDGFLHSLSEKK